MSKKNGIDAFSRRAFLRSAATFGAVACAGAAGAQDALNEIINSPRRGSWDDQYDAKASRTATTVVSNTPVFGPETISHVQQAIFDYQNIVSSGGWPMVATSLKLEIGVTDPSVQQLRQRLMVSGDLPRSAGISSSVRFLRRRRRKALPGPPRPPGGRRHWRIHAEGHQRSGDHPSRPVADQSRAPAVDVR